MVRGVGGPNNNNKRTNKQITNQPDKTTLDKRGQEGVTLRRV